MYVDSTGSDQPLQMTTAFCIGTVHRFHDKDVAPANMVDGWRHVSPKIGFLYVGLEK